MVKLHVTKMSCQGCVRCVTSAILRVEPAAHVSVDLASGTVTVEGAVDPEKIRVAVQGAGFGVAETG